MRGTACLLALLAAAGVAPAKAQLVTPRGDDAIVYQSADIEAPHIVAQIERDAVWRLEFDGAQAQPRLPESYQGPAIKVLMPARHTGATVLAHVRGANKRDIGWVEPGKIDISPDSAWKIRRDTSLFVPMIANQIPPIREAPVPAGVKARAATYLLLAEPDGKVIGVRRTDGAENPALETALKEFRFSPIVVDGDPSYLLLAIKVEGPK